MDIEELRNKEKERAAKLDKSKIRITTYQEMEDFVKNIPDKYEVGVYGVPRGGLMLAVMYSYFHDVPLLQAPAPYCLVIDDDMATGITMSQFIGRYDTAVMFSNTECEVKPTYLYQYYQDDEFRMFPWNTLGEFE